MVGTIGCKVGGDTGISYHYTILIIAEVSAFKPEVALVLIEIVVFLQFIYGFFNGFLIV